MIRLYIDDLTHLIQGYEYLNENSVIFKNDIILDATYDQIRLITDNLGKVYYDSSTGDIYVSETTDDYLIELAEKQQEYSELYEKVSDPSKTILQFALENGVAYDEAIFQFKLLKEYFEEVSAHLTSLEAHHKQQLFEYHATEHNEREKDIDWKHYSSVCLLIRDENQYLEEWIKWHIGIGVDHIYIYDNGIYQNVNDIVDTLSENIKDKITVINWQGKFEDCQGDCYNHFLEYYGHETRWVNFIDSDEFIRITSKDYKNINELLSNFEDYTIVFGKILEYTANGQETKTDLPVRERFTETTLVNDGVYRKDWIQPFRIDYMYIHYPRYSQRGNYVYNNENENKDLFIVDHYYTKSWEEWCVKINRGSATPKLLKSKSEFFLYNPDMTYLKCEEQVQNYNT